MQQISRGIEFYSKNSKKTVEIFFFDTHPLECQYKYIPLKCHIFKRKFHLHI